MELTNRKSLFSLGKISLIASTNTKCKISEQYRTIRTNYLSSIDCLNSKTIIFTSPNSKEGKSTVAANFSISLAQLGKKVLLIDANLRNPILSSSFKTDNSTGLSSVLNGRSRLEAAIDATEIEGLDLLASGPIPFNPSELLGSHYMESLIETVNSLYDIVILDTPSVLEVSDAKILANYCDGLVLVIRYGKTNNGDAMDAKKLLESTHAKLLGIILNDED